MFLDPKANEQMTEILCEPLATGHGVKFGLVLYIIIHFVRTEYKIF